MIFPEYKNNYHEGVYQKIIEVNESQTNSAEFMQIGDLAREMEKITEEHLSTLGMSCEKLKSECKIWVIAWSSIYVKRLPRLGETIILYIWPCKKKSTMYPRKYAFFTLEGEPLVCAASLFLLMDATTRTIAQPTEKLENLSVVVLTGEPELPKMRMAFPKELSRQVERTVRHEEVDKNGHLNNTHYIDWAEELMEKSNQRNNSIKHAWIQYTKELLEGQKVVLKYEYENNTLYIRGYYEDKESFSVALFE